MKKTALAIILFSIFSIGAHAQKMCPNVDVFNAKGESVSINSLVPHGKPVVLTLWDTTCKPCLQELGAYSDLYDEWKEEFDFEVVAVSTDDTRSSSKVVPLAKGRGWPFIIAMDKNGDLKRAMNVNSNPTLFILDKEGRIFDMHIGYTPGDENKVHDILKTLSK